MADNLKVTLELKDVTEDTAVQAELLEKSGQTKTPFLVDSERGASLGDSSDIIDYLREFGTKATVSPVVSRPRVHFTNAVCESCEG